MKSARLKRGFAFLLAAAWLVSMNAYGKGLPPSLRCDSGKDGSPQPAIVILHGQSGGDAFPKLYEGYEKTLVSHGYRVCAYLYYSPEDERIMTGGDPLAKDKRRRERIEAWVESTIHAINSVAASPGIDNERIGLLGFSQGAFVAIEAARRDKQVKALADIYGKLLPEFSQNGAIYPPTLILHGSADTIVPVAEAHRFAEILQAKSVEHKIKIYNGAGHGFDADPASDIASDAHREVADFFDAQFFKVERKRR